MISLVFWEIGGVDWATVVHAVREVDALELCGGRQGLNEVLTDGGYFPWGPREPEPLVQEYIRLLQDYAAQRQAASEKIPIHFTGGKGRIVPNKLARSDRDPSDVGQAWIRGRRYRIRGWRDGDGLDIKFYPEGR